MWKITEGKSSSAQQEVKVKMIVREMAEGTYATYAEAFIEAFKDRLKEIPRTNVFSADHFYKCKEISLYSVEICKLDVKGDFKYRMFTLDYQK